MDISLNGEMNGIETARQIYKLYNIPFIYITGSHNNYLLDKAKQTNPLGFVKKPFYGAEIQSIIETSLINNNE